MLSLRQILSQHTPLLIVDAASARIQVGLFTSEAESIWETIEIEAGIGLFAATHRLLGRSQLTLAAIRAFIFCEGPGSVLGIRTSAVAIRTWNAIETRPVFSFSSLEIVARFQQTLKPGISFGVIADARRDTWHLVSSDSTSKLSPLQRVNVAQLSGPLLMPQYFRHWAEPPAACEAVAYAVRDMLTKLADAPLFTESLEPDAFLHEAPAYLPWVPHIHRAPAPS